MSLSILSKLPLLTSFALGAAIGGVATLQLSESRTDVTRTAPRPTPAIINLPVWSTQAGARPSLLSDAQSRPSVDGLLGLRGDYATRVDTLRALLVVLPSDGFYRLLSGLATQNDDDSRRLLDVALDAWIDRDPAGSARWAISNNTQASRALRAWIKVDPIAAAECVSKLTDPKQLKELTRYTLPALFEQDQERALAMVAALPDELRSNALRTIIQTLSKTDPAGAIRRFGVELWDGGNGYQTLYPALAAWAKSDPRGMAAWLISQPQGNTYQLGSWLSNLAGNNAINWEQIAAVVIATPSLENQQRTLATILKPLGMKDPQLIISFLNGTGDQNLRNQVLLAMASGYQNNRPDQSLPFALAMPDGAERTQKLNWLLSAWAKHDPSAVLDWMSAHDDPAVSRASAAVQSGILINIAQQEPETAVAAWSEVTDDKVRKSALYPIAQAWGKTDPAAALQWLHEQQQQLSPNGYSVSNYTDMIFAWRKNDPEAALHWVEQLPRPKNQSMGYHNDPFEALGSNWNESADRASTAQLLTTIKDASLRTDVLSHHVRNWLKFDRKAATAWLESNNTLSSEQAAALITEANK